MIVNIVPFNEHIQTPKNNNCEHRVGLMKIIIKRNCATYYLLNGHQQTHKQYL